MCVFYVCTDLCVCLGVYADMCLCVVTSVCAIVSVCGDVHRYMCVRLLTCVICPQTAGPAAAA